MVVLTGVAWLLAGCERTAPPEVALTEDGDRLEWRGTLPCADCGGIETTLVLVREGERLSYELAETYLTGAGGDRFVDTGSWEAGGGLLRLQGEDGSRRTYALLQDGRLQARDGDGQRLPGRRDDTLAPAATTGL